MGAGCALGSEGASSESGRTTKLGGEVIQAHFQKFVLGRLYQTSNSLSQLNPSDVLVALGRHAQGDWGDLGKDDWAENERSLHDGERLFSVYHDRNGIRFYVVTEADRECSTILLPEDY